MARSREGLELALAELPALRDEFWSSICVCGGSQEFNVALEKAGRVADYLEFAEVMIRDALTREESCGAHFRVEYQSADGEARRNDDAFAHVATWGFRGDGLAPQRAVEPLTFHHVQPTERNYR
jgi:succinate dehydrogenase / fumarate reductase flavoprotein subunit